MPAMNVPPPRAGIGSPRLIGLLAAAAAAPEPVATPSLAAWLGRNLDLSGAISLSAALAHSDSAAEPNAGRAARPTPVGDLRDEAARLRAAFARAIGSDCAVQDAGVSGANDGSVARAPRSRLPLPRAGVARDGLDFQPYHRYYLARQREMEAAIAPLRERLRAALAAGSPAHAQLAALAAVLAGALAERERSLLADVPQRLEARFNELRAEGRTSDVLSPTVGAPTDSGVAAKDGTLTENGALAEGASTEHRTPAEGGAAAKDEAGPVNAAAAWLRPGGWLAIFEETLRCVLLAELDFRLLPVEGLAAALAGEAAGRGAG